MTASILLGALAAIILLGGIIVWFKYRDSEVIICFVLAAILLFALAGIFAIGADIDTTKDDSSIIDSVHIITDDTYLINIPSNISES